VDFNTTEQYKTHAFIEKTNVTYFSLAYEKSKRRSSSTSKPIEQKVNLNGSGSRQTSRNRHRS